MLTLLNSVISRALWLPQVWYYGVYLLRVRNGNLPVQFIKCEKRYKNEGLGAATWKSKEKPHAAATCSVDAVLRGHPSPAKRGCESKPRQSAVSSRPTCAIAIAPNRWQYQSYSTSPYGRQNFPPAYAHLDLAARRRRRFPCIFAISESSCPARKVDLHFRRSRNLIERSGEYHKWIICGCGADAVGFDICGGGCGAPRGFLVGEGFKVPYLFAIRFSYWWRLIFFLCAVWWM
jgi:hypothetical protein